MPQYHNNILSVTISELEQCGLSAGYLKRALAGQRAGEVYCWEYHKEGKRVYIHFHTMKEQYKTLIKAIFCDGSEPDVYLKNKQENKAKATISELTDQLTALVETDSNEIKQLMETRLYTATEVHQLARAAAWLRLINEFDVRKARKLGYDSIVTLRSEVFKRCLNEQKTELIRFKKGTITNERVLYQNAQRYKQEGIDCMIHRGVGNVNREKADAMAHAKLMELASNPVKYSFEDITMMYNDWADAIEKPNLTVSAVKAHLNTPKVKKVWFYARHGKLAADNEIQPLITRDKPSFPDALWSLDGTSMQLYYRDSIGKIRSDLYAVFIADAHTGAILGHSIAYTETAQMVDEALRNAINLYGYKPYQLQYDNSSANKAAVVQNLMSNMSRVHFACEPYKGRSKYIEGILGHFQQRVLRKRENFKGGNITTRSLNSKANPELLAEFTRKNDPKTLPTLNEVINEFNLAIKEWNERGERRDNYGRFVGESKIQRYVTIQHEKRAKMNYFDRLSLFMVEQKDPYTYSTQGIKINIKGKDTFYIVPDPDSIGDFMFSNEHLGEKFTVKIDKEKPEMCVLLQNGIFVAHAYEKERYASCVADIKDGEKAKQIIFKAKQDEYGQQYSIRELERQMSILGELRATGTDGFGWWDRTKTVENNIENTIEDVYNGITDGMTDRQRLILNIGR
jgi:hypothetical protein